MSFELLLLDEKEKNESGNTKMLIRDVVSQYLKSSYKLKGQWGIERYEVLSFKEDKGLVDLWPYCCASE